MLNKFSTRVSRRLLIQTAVVAGLGVGIASPALAQYNLTLCGASPGGLWSLLGGRR